MTDTGSRPPAPSPDRTPNRSQAIGQPALDAARIIMRLAIALLLIGVPVASVITVRAVYALVPIGAALTLVAWLLAPGERGPSQLRAALFSPIGLVSLFCMAWALASLMWTPFSVGPSERFVKSISVCFLVAAAMALLPERTRTANLYLLPLGVACGAIAAILLASLDASAARSVDPGDISLLWRVVYGLSLLVWPAMGALAIRERPVMALGLAGLVIAATATAQTTLALIASAIGAAKFFGMVKNREFTIRLGGASAAATILVAPVFAYLTWWIWGLRAPALLAPAALWGQILSLDDIRALTGHGFDAARLGASVGYLPFNAPRSALFEIWYDFGIIGACAAAYAMVMLTLALGRARADLAPFIAGGLASAYILCAFGLGIGMVWWITLLALDAFAYALLRHARPRKRAPARRPHL